ncbi:MAG TPA: signal peptidase I [Stellaceae bacterium]|nr:signal peptidase I [Stellaceae bacterium]
MTLSSETIPRPRWRSGAFLLSLIFPGVGQSYAGAQRRALAFASVALAWSLAYHLSPWLWAVRRSAILPPAILALVLLGVVLPLSAAIDAARLARRGLPRLSRWRRWAAYVAFAAVPALPGLAAMLAWQSFVVPSESMVPTMLLGDRLFAAVGYYRVFAPRQGELAVFALPQDPATFIVKRIIGLPGERVQVTNGVVAIDGAASLRTPLGGGSFMETLPGGAPHPIIVAHDDAPLENTGVFTVPPDRYFMMGDNRDDSLDSRDPGMGFVPAESLYAAASFVVYSTEGAAPWWRFSAWRWRRFAMVLR